MLDYILSFWFKFMLVLARKTGPTALVTPQPWQLTKQPYILSSHPVVTLRQTRSHGATEFLANRTEQQEGRPLWATATGDGKDRRKKNAGVSWRYDQDFCLPLVRELEENATPVRTRSSSAVGTTHSDTNESGCHDVGRATAAVGEKTYWNTAAAAISIFQFLLKNNNTPPAEYYWENKLTKVDMKRDTKRIRM